MMLAAIQPAWATLSSVRAKGPPHGEVVLGQLDEVVVDVVFSSASREEVADDTVGTLLGVDQWQGR